MVKKRPGKKDSITSSKPLAGEALYNALAGDAHFANITQIDAAVMQEQNGIHTAEHTEQVKQRELAVLRAVTQHPLSEPEFLGTTSTHRIYGEKDPIGETAWRISLSMLSDFYVQAGLEKDLAGGQQRADRFLAKALETIDKINGKDSARERH